MYSHYDRCVVFIHYVEFLFSLVVMKLQELRVTCMSRDCYALEMNWSNARVGEASKKRLVRIKPRGIWPTSICKT